MTKEIYYTSLEDLQQMVDEAHRDMQDKEVLYEQYRESMDRYVLLRTKLNQELANLKQFKLPL